MKEKVSNRLSYYDFIEVYNLQCCGLSPDIVELNIKKEELYSFRQLSS